MRNDENMREHSFHHHHHWLHILLMLIGGLAIFGVITMLLWNALLPGIFALPKIDFLQALGLLVLSRLLFGGLGHAHALMHRGHGGDFRRRMMERWQGMSPEEREKFRERFGHHGFDRRCGHGHGDDRCCHGYERKNDTDRPETREKPNENESAKTDNRHE